LVGFEGLEPVAQKFGFCRLEGGSSAVTQGENVLITASQPMFWHRNTFIPTFRVPANQGPKSTCLLKQDSFQFREESKSVPCGVRNYIPHNRVSAKVFFSFWRGLNRLGGTERRNPEAAAGGVAGRLARRGCSASAACPESRDD